jgi:hypothetical protein
MLSVMECLSVMLSVMEEMALQAGFRGVMTDMTDMTDKNLLYGFCVIARLEHFAFIIR